MFIRSDNRIQHNRIPQNRIVHVNGPLNRQSYLVKVYLTIIAQYFGHMYTSVILHKVQLSYINFDTSIPLLQTCHVTDMSFHKHVKILAADLYGILNTMHTDLPLVF